MAREPAITFRGALRILGRYDRPWLDRLDGLLGGVVLASGAVPAIGALWGWVDQKSAATDLLRRALDAAFDRLTRTGGLARHELVVSAHTTLVLAAFFETLRDRLGQKYDEAEFTKAEKVMLGTGQWQTPGQPLVRHLYEAQVPVPSALWGFEENTSAVARWALDRIGAVGNFLYRLGFRHELVIGSFAGDVTERYRSEYLRLAAAVPEFKVWADLGEHAATRTALARLEELLSQCAKEVASRDLRALLGAVNRAELTRPVIDVDIDGYGIDAVFPTVERIFLTPHFRSTPAHRAARIGDEHWWADVEPRRDLDVVLARHFTTPESTELPLLLLGHPGGGKSLLMKVLAARLPEAMYTVVRVPLRRVDADAHVSAQIQQALTIASHGRILWPSLVDQSAEAIRVILLDGLDELLQATTNDRAGYLTDIAEFQRVEAAMGKPVAVVVTSRTLVADRVRVPEGTPVLKLEEFDDDQIQEWLRIWHEINGDTRPVPLEVAMEQYDLARQPLLLLMLTLYFADPDVELTDSSLSTVELYRRLFDTYARREATKQAGHVLPEPLLEEAVRTQLGRLSIAALGMFNRGRQSITEAELSADLAALGEPAPAGIRVLGQFFFVHATEVLAGDVQRGYEFLHATFAEYLVATRVVEVLVDVAESAYGRRRFHEPDDELLYALLSHQPLAVQRPMLEFVGDRLKAIDVSDRTDVCQTLDLLIRGYRCRRMTSRHLDYRPLPPDTVRTQAAYSANLVLLRVLAGSERVELTTLWPDAPSTWPATVNLWAAGLDAEAYRAMLWTVDCVENSLILKETLWSNVVLFDDFNAARLRGDRTAERRLRYGHAALHELIYFDQVGPQTWKDSALSNLVSLTTGQSPSRLPEDVPASVPCQSMAAVAAVACGVLAIHSVNWDRVETERFLRWLMLLPAPEHNTTLPLALAEHIHPGLLGSLRTAPNKNWTVEWRGLLDATTQENAKSVDIAVIAEYLKEVMPAAWRHVPADNRDFPDNQT